MTHPRKKKGAREIRVGGRVFRWRFDAGAESSEIVVRPLDGGPAVLTVVLPEWCDPWLCISGFRITEAPRTLVLETSARNEPDVITPGFVADAIRRALALGWDPAGGAASARLVYRDGDFASLSA